MREVFDLEPVEYPTATADPEWLANNPEARAVEVMNAFRDPDISAVIANIGGHDQITILPYLDGDVLRENPTRFYGYSDNTNYPCSSGITGLFRTTADRHCLNTRWMARCLTTPKSTYGVRS